MGGVIGGKGQKGKWSLYARFDKKSLIKRIEKIGRFRSRINLSNMDAIDFLIFLDSKIKSKLFIYLDPPYYFKGKKLLYTNYYNEDDHLHIAKRLRNLNQSWVLSYDNVTEIKNLYYGFYSLTYSLNYSAQNHYKGEEILFFSKDIKVPEINNPIRLNIN